MIFVHSSFRTGSTYIWSHLRKSPSTIAYYEVFNEILHSLRPESITSVSAERWNSKHPPGSPYFLEFLPLLKADGGLEGFNPQMSFEQFIPLDGCGGPVGSAEASYVKRLIEHAEGRGRIPILTSTRSLGRVRGLKLIAPGLHLLLYRNLFQQWCSVTHQVLSGNRYFLEKIIEIIRLGRHDPVLDAMQRVFPLDEASIRRPETFAVFVLLHLHLYVQAAGAVDLIIDLNRLESNPAHRQTVERLLAEQAIDMTLSDIRNTTNYSLCPLGTNEDLQERLKVLGDMILDRAPDILGREFGETVLSDLIEEHGRHEFYASGLRKTLVELQQLSASRDHLPHQIAVISAERDVLQQQCDQAEQVGMQRVSIHEATLLELGQIRRQLDDAHVICATLAAERDAAFLDRDIVRSDRDAVLEAHDRLRIDHEALLTLQQHEQNQWAAAQAKFAAQVTRLEEELADRGAFVLRLQDQIQAAQVSLRAECDQALVVARLVSREREDQQNLNCALSRARTAILADRDRQQERAGRLATRIRELEQEIDLLIVGCTAAQDQGGRIRPERFSLMLGPVKRSTNWRQTADKARDIQDWTGAVSAYRRYLELKPGDSAIWVQYGHALKEAGILTSALAAYCESRRLRPVDSDRDVHLFDLRRRLMIDLPDDPLHSSEIENSASTSLLLVTTTLAAWVLDTDTGQAHCIHQGSGVYYGISFSEDTLFIGCRRAVVGAEQATQNNVILCFDRHLIQREVLTPPWPMRDVHQIFYHDGTLYICATYDDAVLEYDVVLRSWQRWHPFGEPEGLPDQHHINSILVEKDCILLAGNAPEGWIAWFGPDRHYSSENRHPIGSGTHNVWREQGRTTVCSSNEGGIRSEDGGFRAVCENGWVRGVALAGRDTYIGVSQNLARDAREQSDCAIVQFDHTGAVFRCYAFQNYGMLHDMRILGNADPTHNGIKFHLAEAALHHAKFTYQVGPDMVEL